MARVTLDQLRAFERIVRLGSFQAAAGELGLTQPSISQRIRELESALETQLFVRKGPRIAPNAEAHALLPYCTRLLDADSEMRERFRTRDPLRGVLRIGVSENFALICLPELFQRLEARYPTIQASVFVGDSGTLSERLNKHALDIAIVSEPVVEPHVVQVPVGRSRLAWFAGPAVRLPRQALTARELSHHHLMLMPPSARLHATVLQWFADGEASPLRVSTCNNAAVTRTAILGGAAIGILPVRIMEADLAARAVRIVAVRPAMPSHRVSICVQHSAAGPAQDAFVDLLRDLIVRHRVFDALDLSTPRR